MRFGWLPDWDYSYSESTSLFGSPQSVLNTDSKLFQLPYPIPVFCLLLQVTNFPLSRCLGHRGFYSTNEISRSVDERRFESWRPAIPVTLSCNFPSAGPLCGLRGLNITPKFPPFVSRPSTTSHLIRLSLPAGLKVTKRSFTFLTLSSKYFQSLAALLPEHSCTVWD